MRAKMMIRILLTLAFTVVAVQAHALSITPDTLGGWSGSQTSLAEIEEEIADIMGIGSDDPTLLYKAEVEVPVTELGPFANSYETIFSPDPEDPENATITYEGGDIIDYVNTYLLIKDGNQDPAWYLYDISDWNGTETINITDFWPQQGAISHVAIYTDAPAPVPEPATMLLFGTGLAGIAGARLRKNKK